MTISAHDPIRRVHLLPPQVSEKIAAGEVIERPASVVKELVENSLDAGATEVTVILEQGGKGLIEVTDNGCGMSPRDLELAIERHATSKIANLSDLESISTLGFRGEALPSIAAVSELEIVSNGNQVRADERHGEGVRATPLTFGHFLGSPHGTRIRARGLFSQLPARLKFLRSQGAEVSQVREWIERLALTHPATGFRLVSDDRLILNLRPQTEEERVRLILSDGGDYPLISASSDLGIGAPAPLRVRAHWLQGLSSPQTRKLAQVVNGRAVRDRLLQQAILSPFRQALLPGQFPAVALFLEIDPGQLDVNVHPTKTEIRFLRSREVFHAVQSLLEEMIGRTGASGYVTGAFRGSPVEAATPDRAGTWSAAEGTASDSRGWSFREAPAISLPASPTTTGTTAASTHPFADARFRGIVFDTYLLLETSAQELVLVDQHAAHERIRFERLRTRALGGQAGAGAQALLIPEAIRIPTECRMELERRIALLAALGFEAELFGEDTLLFRAIPADWGTRDLRPRLKNLTDRVLSIPEEELGREGRELLIDEALFEKLASEACHSAIRAGDVLEEVEAESLIRDLFECEHPWNCPHGRPTTVRVPRARFEEWFQRRV